VAAVVASPTIAHEPYTDAFVHARPWAACALCPAPAGRPIAGMARRSAYATCCIWREPPSVRLVDASARRLSSLLGPRCPVTDRRRRLNTGADRAPRLMHRRTTRLTHIKVTGRPLEGGA
jgi:hypothetical protein